MIASWLFLVGSSLFMIDAISEMATHFSAMSLLHLSEGILFLIGSVFFMPSSEANSSPSFQATCCNHHAAMQKQLAPTATDFAGGCNLHEQ